MKHKYTHTFDIAFSVHTNEEDWEKIPLETLLDALRERMMEADLEAFGFVDTLEMD